MADAPPVRAAVRPCGPFSSLVAVLPMEAAAAVLWKPRVDGVDHLIEGQLIQQGLPLGIVEVLADAG